MPKLIVLVEFVVTGGAGESHAPGTLGKHRRSARLFSRELAGDLQVDLDNMPQDPDLLTLNGTFSQ